MDEYILTKGKENDLVKNATIVFDTSSIGQLYEMTEIYKQQLVGIIDHFKDRMWLPAQVKSEYLKNRIKFLFNPINVQYKFPAFMSQDIISGVESFISKHKDNPYFHPYLDDGEIDKLISEKEKMKVACQSIKDIVKKQYIKRKDELRRVENDDKKDIIFKTFSTIKEGKAFSFKELLDIVKEGEIRYRHSIPPGYMDSDKKTKKGVHIFGDLVIWKEILSYSKKHNNSILFVCDDVKEDWYETNNKNDEDLMPRKELLQEFNEYTQQDVWIVPLSKFIKLLESYFKDETRLSLYNGLEAVLEALDEVEKRKKSTSLKLECLYLRCKECHEIFNVDPNDFNLEWTVETLSERPMGEEIEYSCILNVRCPDCGQAIDIKPHVWEYPNGVFNHESLSLEGADVIKGRIIWRNHIDLMCIQNDDEMCVKCGQHGPVGDDGLCEECSNEYNYGID